MAWKGAEARCQLKSAVGSVLFARTSSSSRCQAQPVRLLLQAAIRDGYVCINGKPQPKTSYAVRAGDCVLCVLPPPPPLEALPEVCYAFTSVPFCVWSAPSWTTGLAVLKQAALYMSFVGQPFIFLSFLHALLPH